MRRFLTVLGLLAGFFFVELGFCGFLAVACRDPQALAIPGFGITMSVVLLLGAGLLRLSVLKWNAPGQKRGSLLPTRILLRVFGVMTLLSSVVPIQIAQERHFGPLGMLPICLLTMLVFSFGCWLIADAANYYDPGEKPSRVMPGRFWVFKVGRWMLILAWIGLAISKPLTGVAALILFGALALAANFYVRSRIKGHKDGVMTPLGRVDAAKAKLLENLAEGVLGWIFTIFELALEIVVAALTGADAGFSGGGGSSGGGGAGGDF